MVDLLEIISLFQQNSENFTNVLVLFKSKINYLSYKLKYPEAATDLLIYLYEFTSNLDLTKFNTSTELFKYIHTCLNNKSKNLYKSNNCKIDFNVVHLDSLLLSIPDLNDSFSNITFFHLISTLPYKQQLILYYKFYLQFSDIEISNILNISRQAVNKSKRLALNKLKSKF